MRTEGKEISIIGAAILDVLAGPVREELFWQGTQPMEFITLSFGDDAQNEAAALAKMGKRVELISKVGDDKAGTRVLEYLKDHGIQTGSVRVEPGLETGINIVLIDKTGERHFLTNPKGSLRTLTEKDVEPYLDAAADIVSFASMFVSSLLDIPAMERIFRRIKSRTGRILLADLTTPKQGERLVDLNHLLPYIDYLLPNETEIEKLTGESDPDRNAERMIQSGVSCAVIKRGKNGCLIRTKQERYLIPAYPIAHPVDTTGAGDCFAAGFLWALSQDMPLQECGRFACAAASCSVECAGAVEGIHSLEEPMRRYRWLCECQSK